MVSREVGDRIERWLGDVSVLKARCEGELLSTAVFQQELLALIGRSRGLVQAAEYAVSRGAPFADLRIGEAGIGEATEINQFDLDEFATLGRLRVWRRADLSGIEVTSIQGALEQLLREQWHGPLRDAPSRLISRSQGGADALMNLTLAAAQSRGEASLFLFADLDHFKTVNDTFDMQKGDEVILAFSALLEEAAGSGATVLHRSGDEFLVLQAPSSAEAGLNLAKGIAVAVGAKDFGVGDLRITSKVGLVIQDPDESFKSYKELEPHVEEGFKIGGGDKLRNVARFPIPSEVALPAAEEANENAAVSVVKSLAASASPFRSPWLNLLSEEVYGLTKGRVPSCQDVVDEFVEWSRIDFVPDRLVAALASDGPQFLEAVASYEDVLMAAAHGVMRQTLRRTAEGDASASASLTILRSAEGEYSLVAEPGSEVLVSLKGAARPAEARGAINLGAPVELEPGTDPGTVDSRRALLVRVGNAKSSFPSNVFFDVITVDDRPGIGGGLPDFWEAALAATINGVAENPNLTAVVFFGDPAHAPETVARLQDVEGWAETLELLSYKTGLSESAIRSAAEAA